MQNLEIHTKLPLNQSLNPNRINLCFPIKIIKSTNTAQSIDATIITVNSFLAQCTKES